MLGVTRFTALVPIICVACSPSRDYSTADSGTSTDDTADDVVAVDTTPPYPDPPHGLKNGSYFPRGRLQGYVDAVEPWREDLSTADYYDPRGERGTKLLVVNFSAQWCIPCKDLAKATPGFVATYAPFGVKFVDLVVQNSIQKPATRTTVDQWIAAYRLDTDVLIDPFNEVMPDPMPGDWAFPTTVFVDPRTMYVLRASRAFDKDQPWLYTNNVNGVLTMIGAPHPDAGPPDTDVPDTELPDTTVSDVADAITDASTDAD